MVQRFTSSNLGILVDFIHISSIPTCNYTVNTNLQTFTHNLPPAEANKREKKFSGDTPDPVRGASPPAPPLYEWMSGASLANLIMNCSLLLLQER